MTNKSKNININMESKSKKFSESKSINSLNTLHTIREEEEDTFKFRIDFVRALLKDNKLQPLINLDSCDTEAFTKPINDSSEEYNMEDTRHILSKKNYNFNQIIHQIGGKLKYIKSGTTGHTFQGRIKLDDENNEINNEFNYAVKVVAYPKKDNYGEHTDIKRPENAELYMLKVLSYFIITGQTPHIIMPIGTFDTNIEPFTKLIDDGAINKDNVKYQEFVDKYQKRTYYDTVSILISEWANRGDLLDFIKKNYKKFNLLHWKVIFFQIISTLAVIQSKYPSFRHNDLKANNILVHKLGTSNPRFGYHVKGIKFAVPNIGYRIKICDFDFACIPGVVENSKVSAEWTQAINVNPEQNRYYDLHFFFNTLIRKGFFPEFLTDNTIPKQVVEFVDRILPIKYRNSKYVHKRGRLLINKEHITPIEILKTDEFFQEFIKQKKRK